MNPKELSDEAPTSRREFLRSTAGGVILGLDGLSVAPRKEFTLVGTTAGWRGLEPESINGEKNPALRLNPGQNYRITWQNGDGVPHNLALTRADGTRITSTDIVAGKKTSRTLDFEASSKMDRYICEIHPGTMRGEFDIPGQTQTTLDSEPFFSSGPSVKLEKVAGGLLAPTTLTYANESADRRYVADRSGRIYVHGPDGLAGDVFLDIRDRLAELEGERGLVGLAFHPRFRENGKFYVRYSAPIQEQSSDRSHTEVLSEFRVPPGSDRANPNSERVLFEASPHRPLHVAGPLAFGPDGNLYVTLGDGGSRGTAQDLTSPFGSILRIDVDERSGNKPYGIPSDNPLVGRPGMDELYAVGLRNPWHLSFDGNRRLFVANVGESAFEQVELVVKGGNYGWSIREGTQCYDGWYSSFAPDERDKSKRCPTHNQRGEPLLDPIIQYPHRWGPNLVGSAITGGYFHAGDGLPALRNKYVFADLGFSERGGTLFAASPPSTSGEMWSVKRVDVTNFGDGWSNPLYLAMGRDSEDRLYLLTTQSYEPNGKTGAVYRLTSTG